MADATASLNFLITAQDEASSTLASVGGSLEKTKASLEAIAVASGLAFAAIVGESKEALDAAAKYQNTEAQLNAVIKSTGDISGESADQVNALSDALEKTSGYSHDTITQIQTLLIGMKDISSGTVPAATQAILDFAARTGNDAVDSANQLGKALADPAKAVGILTREHVILTQAQQDSIKAFDAVGNTAGAQGVIIEALNQTYGGAAEQTQTLAFQQRLLKSETEGLQESIGTALLPVITQLLAAVTPLLLAVAKWIEDNPTLTKYILVFGAALTGLTILVSTLTLAVLAFDTAMLPVAAVVLGVVAAIGGLILIGYNLYNIVQDLYVLWPSVWAAIEKSTKEVIDQLTAYIQPFVNLLDSVLSKIQSVASSVGGALSSVGHSISSAIPHATGGNVSAGQTYLIGESGPELFTSSLNGSITPNSQIGSGNGGGIVINVNGGNYLDQNAATMFGNLLARTIQQQLKLRTF